DLRYVVYKLFLNDTDLLALHTAPCPGYLSNNHSTSADTMVLELFMHALSCIFSLASFISLTITSKTSLFHQTSLLDILALLLALVTSIQVYNSTSSASPQISALVPWILANNHSTSANMVLKLFAHVFS
ncbi:hypothetical protein WG66_008902, partial [Moniliophthora roreri]